MGKREKIGKGERKRKVEREGWGNLLQWLKGERRPWSL